MFTRFRPCIDLHGGQVKQIVGGTLGDDAANLQTNHISTHSAAYFAKLYRQHNLTGGHVIQLGPGNESAAREALSAWPNGLQIGGGIRPSNAHHWLDAGASHLIVTSYLFNDNGEFQAKKLSDLVKEVGANHLVIDLSCRQTASGWTVAMNRWQTPTNLRLSHTLLDDLAASCAEFLIHAADIEGLCQGVDRKLVEFLGSWGRHPITYAGGASELKDLQRVNQWSNGKVDLTIGSALDIFGGHGVQFDQAITWNKSPIKTNCP